VQCPHLRAIGGKGTAIRTLQPTTTESEGAEGLVDVLEEFLKMVRQGEEEKETTTLERGRRRGT
jgi:hypothetical protein